jgi:DNA-binding NtrC family response regulator
MTEERQLEGKTVLIVDDEPDVLDTLVELLNMCMVTKASNFEQARDLLENQTFDIAILDIMGVNGYRLLDLAKKKYVIPVMLTAHALSVVDTVKSFKRGAASYLPKDEMINIVIFLNDILEAKEKGKNFWWRWMERFEAYYDKKFGPDWKKKDKDFWETFNFRT